ncbi:hypothetical protein [Paludisphaera mucosa]|uniref:Peptidase M10 metallopeptidase domain-containing protein n=1 Tax=Paludisphaera mucosa TaxID=3030827 RepID=A0ABT6FI40_9BACT|nr:hypothetical protein [Paludisphaera mucosa]MDG3007263.1 hypothetical protein [Paludisphaera mucosa]
MATVHVNLGEIGPHWTKACKKAVADLNALFHRKGVAVVLSASGAEGPSITVRTDSGILGTAVHGKTTAETGDGGRLLRAEVRLPVKVVINTPDGVRQAGPGVLKVIAAHEFVHALGQVEHSSHLMAQTLYKQLGNSPAGDTLKAGAVTLPPLSLASDTVELLKSIWG